MAGFPDTGSVLLLVTMTLVLNAVAAAAYPARHAGIRTGLLATAGTVYGILSLVGRTAGTLQAPVLNKSVELSALSGGGIGEPFLRILLAVTAVGTLVTLLVYPSVTAVMEKATRYMAREGSAPKLLVVSARKALSRETYGHRVHLVSGLRGVLVLARSRPWLFAGITLVTAANAASAYSAALAALALPELRATCLSLTAVINAGATIAMTIWIDPQVAIETDRAIRGEMSDKDLGDLAVARMLATVAGQVLAQAVLVPGSLAIMAVARAL